VTRLAALLAVIGTVALAAPAQAQSYPNRPIRLIAPFPAGGPVDVMARLVAQQLSASLGQQMIVDNRPGAGGTLAGREAARAEPDGYTLLFASAAPTAIGPALFKNIGYDPIKSFAPVAFVSSVPYVMVAGPKTPAKTVQDTIAYAKANPGKLNFGVPNGAPPHMLAGWFKSLTGTDIVVVPYKGAAFVITDLIGGQIDLGFETTSVTLTHVHEGKIRPLGVATRARLPDLAQVPTMIESGVADFVASSWTGVLAPAGTPPEIVRTLNAAINEGINSPALRTRFKQLAAEARPGSPEDFGAFIAAEAPKWSAMAKLSAVTAE